MVFISGTPKDDSLIIRDIPIVLALTVAGLSAGLFALAYNADQGGDIKTSRFLVAIGVAIFGLAAALLKTRTYTFRRTDPCLTIRENRLFRRKTTSHALSEAAQAELVITKGDENDDLFQACLATEDGRLELDIGSSFAPFSARIVFSVNAWLHGTPTKGLS